MALTRRELLGGAAGAAVAGTGIYALVDKLAQAPQRKAAGPLARSSTCSTESRS